MKKFLLGILMSLSMVACIGFVGCGTTPPPTSEVVEPGNEQEEITPPKTEELPPETEDPKEEPSVWTEEDRNYYQEKFVGWYDVEAVLSIEIEGNILKVILDLEAIYAQGLDDETIKSDISEIETARLTDGETEGQVIVEITKPELI